MHQRLRKRIRILPPAGRVLLAMAFVLCSLGAAAASQWSLPRVDSPQVTVIADGETREFPTSAATVAHLLDALQITLAPLDRTDPPLHSPITDGTQVRVTRVTCRDVTEEIPLPARTIVLGDPDRPFGSATVLAHGQDGLVRRVWRTWEKDGEITSQTALSAEMVSEPRDTVVLRGIRGLSGRAGYWRNWRAPLDMEATAYEPGPRSCGRFATGYTATGIKAEKGVVAVDERVIPLGTRLYIPGYGFALAADRGGAIKGMRIDLCFATYDEAIRFGRRRLKVYRLD
jgi:3D (Asp-Asp-Asp) domain-containing protein